MTERDSLVARLTDAANSTVGALKAAVTHYQNAKPTIQRMPQTPARDEALQWFDRAEAALSGEPPQPVADADADADAVLSRGMPFSYDPATGFFHADDGGAPASAISYIPDSQIASLIKERDEWREAHRKLQAEQYEHPWTVNQAAQERQKREAAESRLAELEQEAVKVVEPCQRVLAGLSRPDGPISGLTIQQAWAQCVEAETAARAFLDQLRRPS